MKIRPTDITTESQADGKVLTLVAGVPTWTTATGGGGGTWGSITGTLSDQTDLNTALSGKLATTGNGSSLTGLTKTQVGLGSVDNTADTAKPVSTAQQTALNLKANLTGATFSGAISATNLSGSNTGDQDLSSYATTSALTTGLAGKQASSTQLTALAGATWASGTQVVTLTAANTITLKTVGSASGNLLDKAAGDALYQPLDSDLTAVAALTTTTYGRSQLALADATADTAQLNAVVGDSGSGGTKGLVPAPAAGDAAAGKYLKANGTWATPAGGGATAPQVDVYTTTGAFTWTKPTGAVWVEVIAIGAGGGGGCAYANASDAGGGQGGGGGGWSRTMVLASSLGSTVGGSVGASGAGSANVNNNGSDGGASYFGTSPYYCIAGGGTGGQRGTAGGGKGSNTGRGGSGQNAGGNGGTAPSDSITLWPESLTGQRGTGYAPSGGGGGGTVSGGTAFQGNQGGGYPEAVVGVRDIIYFQGTGTTQVATLNAGGGGTAGASGGAGGAGAGFSSGDFRGGQGGGGGGGKSGSGGGTGGGGAFPGGGGGGGGAATSAGTYGSGGAGANGQVIVRTYF